MKATVLCYDKCSTCQKALKWLDARGADYAVRPIKEENPTETELRKKFKISDDDFTQWVAAGVLLPEWRLDAARNKETMEASYTVTDAELPKRFGRKQQEIYEWIKAQGGTAKHSAVLAQFGSCSPMLHRLEELGLI